MNDNPPAPIESFEGVDWYRFPNDLGAVVQPRLRPLGDVDWVLTSGQWFGDEFVSGVVSPDVPLHTPLIVRRGMLASLRLTQISRAVRRD